MRKNREFQWVFRRGRSTGSKALVLVAVQTKSEVHIGFSVSKKYGGAVSRNRIKRRLKEILRGFAPQVPNGWRLIFVPRPGADELTPAQLTAQVALVLRRAGVCENLR